MSDTVPPTPISSILPPARRFTDAEEPPSTVIGARTRVAGTLSADGPVEVAGTVEGDCRVSGLCRVHAGGRVTGDVKATSIVVEGEVTGRTLEAEKVEIGASARVRADVRARRVAIAEGGFLEGHVHMDDAEGPREPTVFTEKRQPRKDEPSSG